MEYILQGSWKLLRTVPDFFLGSAGNEGKKMETEKRKKKKRLFESLSLSLKHPNRVRKDFLGSGVKAWDVRPQISLARSILYSGVRVRAMRPCSRAPLSFPTLIELVSTVIALGRGKTSFLQAQVPPGTFKYL
jgi:hypothetical protein